MVVGCCHCAALCADNGVGFTALHTHTLHVRCGPIVWLRSVLAPGVPPPDRPGWCHRRIRAGGGRLALSVCRSLWRVAAPPDGPPRRPAGRYTLLVGRPPFETESLKETYTRIKKNEYNVPKTVGPLARNLIHRILQGDPSRRPTVDQILHDDFMTMGERLRQARTLSAAGRGW